MTSPRARNWIKTSSLSWSLGRWCDTPTFWSPHTWTEWNKRRKSWTIHPLRGCRIRWKGLKRDPSLSWSKSLLALNRNRPEATFQALQAALKDLLQSSNPIVLGLKSLRTPHGQRYSEKKKSCDCDQMELSRRGGERGYEIKFRNLGRNNLIELILCPEKIGLRDKSRHSRKKRSLQTEFFLTCSWKHTTLTDHSLKVQGEFLEQEIGAISRMDLENISISAWNKSRSHGTKATSFHLGNFLALRTRERVRTDQNTSSICWTHSVWLERKCSGWSKVLSILPIANQFSYQEGRSLTAHDTFPLLEGCSRVLAILHKLNLYWLGVQCQQHSSLPT